MIGKLNLRTRNWAAHIVALLCAWSLAGCGGKPASAPPGAETQTAAPEIDESAGEITPGEAKAEIKPSQGATDSTTPEKDDAPSNDNTPSDSDTPAKNK